MVEEVTNCSEVVDYSEDICQDELQMLQTCFSGDDLSSLPPPVTIPATPDQPTNELKAMVWLGALTLLTPTQECVEKLRPFLCLHIFGLCDAVGRFHSPTREDCLEIRDTLCPSAWSRAVEFLEPNRLPDCESLPEASEECVSKPLIS